MINIDARDTSRLILSNSGVALGDAPGSQGRGLNESSNFIQSGGDSETLRKISVEKGAGVGYSQQSGLRGQVCLRVCGRLHDGAPSAFRRGGPLRVNWEEETT